MPKSFDDGMAEHHRTAPGSVKAGWFESRQGGGGATADLAIAVIAMCHAERLFRPTTCHWTSFADVGLPLVVPGAALLWKAFNADKATRETLLPVSSCQSRGNASTHLDWVLHLVNALGVAP